MDLKVLRRRCKERLRELDLPARFDASGLCQTLAQRRGRPIVLRPVKNGAGPCGVWVASPSADFIFYELDTSPLHQQHIILHEASHLLCDHYAAPVAEAELRRLLFPDLQPAMVQRMLQRTTYSAEEEQEAELLASLLLERISADSPPAAWPPNPEAAALLARLKASLEEGPETPS